MALKPSQYLFQFVHQKMMYYQNRYELNQWQEIINKVLFLNNNLHIVRKLIHAGKVTDYTLLTD